MIGLLKAGALLFAMLSLCTPAAGQWQLDAEAGFFKPERNRVQIPNDALGDRFNITDLGDSAFPAARLTLRWQPADEHELQFVYAPFVYEEEGVFAQQVRFDGATFAAGSPVEARYQFSNYRVRYLYHWLDKGPWRVDFGATLFVRDASIRLRSAARDSEDSNVGVVPLFAFRSTYKITGQLSAVLDTDVAVAPQGRAIDLALLGQYRINDALSLSAGYRTIEGGADNDDVYSFAWFNGAVLGASLAF